MGTQLPFRFGIFSHNTSPSPERLRSQARLAEDLGYSTFLVPDHLGDQFAPALALLQAAQATTTLHIGSFVFANDFRHPLLLAKEAATLDAFSNGRFEFGLGAGWMRSEYEQIGLSFEAPSVRIERMGEALRLIKDFFTRDELSFSGSYYTVKALPCLPRVVQAPHPPIYVGGSGKRMLTLAAQEATCVGLIPRVRYARRGGHMNDVLDVEDASAAATKQKLGWIREAAGARFDELELNIVLMDVRITEHKQQALQEYMERYALSEEELEKCSFLLIGDKEEVIDKVKFIREEYGVTYFVAWEEHIQQLAPVVAQLS
ncbi:TIGR03621 family F420-dependent LLM class oxidoreductase [Ktedonosporobacter rubrisoli]|uniref:TIGR03621 family F420-dependent LLM class oxidoreductase n=1 Tax=Ktedonosporobacter rubrisoli TaxID=2509675 RepID=A0A4P6K0U7_KTERU|nr:TIGR03621 family F420-dependent LLM class oxidoreductase [Ktedonosporobacter rubrisoli]QBD81674.1 TIGR03621 family F420-dependent LLM class oxidoreductase [Ktedonosporobacter rubrisoli]